MPELPEVETIARGLAPWVTGRTIQSVETLWEKSVADGPPGLSREALKARLPGSTITRVHRRAKLLLLDLETAGKSPLTLAFHLKMTGGLIMMGEGPGLLAAPPDYARILFPLDDGSTLCFRDMRKFGWCRAFEDGTLHTWPFWASLGPEPLELDDAAFTALFVSLFRGRRARIKALLLDQSVIAGIGNIYADEALFRAGVRPDATADGISAARLKRLGREVRAVLAEGIAANGSSIRDYRDAGGNAGAFQNDFRVYGRGGDACRQCGKTLRVTRVAGRTSTFCPGCQR